MHIRHFAIGIGLLAMTSGSASACITLGRASSTIGVDQEKAIIIWNARTQTEHFIRQAQFRTDTHDFGFLVPTPSVPSLKAADPNVFSTIEDKIFPRNRATLSMSGAVAGALPVGSQRIEIFSRQNVAGYEATVLKAKDVGALNTWLLKNGYQHGSSLNAWLKPYISQGWAITAFKVKRTEGRLNGAKLSPVRMTFHTDTPFYPYREPAAAPEPGLSPAPRLLRVFYIWTGEAAGTLGHNAKWPARAIWSNTLTGISTGNTPLTGQIARKVGLRSSDIPKNAWLTVFDDHSSPRPATADLYFHSSATPTS